MKVEVFGDLTGHSRERLRLLSDLFELASNIQILFPLSWVLDVDLSHIDVVKLFLFIPCLHR
jgi:hypothetical protein